jgi:hypothetical protein
MSGNLSSCKHSQVPWDQDLAAQRLLVHVLGGAVCCIVQVPFGTSDIMGSGGFEGCQLVLLAQHRPSPSHHCILRDPVYPFSHASTFLYPRPDRSCQGSMLGTYTCCDLQLSGLALVHGLEHQEELLLGKHSPTT